MTRLRHDLPRFAALDTSMAVLVPNGPNLLARTLPEIGPNYPVLMDKGSKVAQIYSGLSQYWLTGTPMAFLIDESGKVCYTQFVDSQSDELDNEKILTQLVTIKNKLSK